MVAAPSPGSFGSDEDHWFGGDDRDAEARAEQSVAAVGARIIGAKPFPIAAKRLEELTRNPKARLEQVVSVLETDPGLSVRLLRLVNSAGYGLKVRVTSVRHAAVLVGTRRLHQVATTAAILDLFATSNRTAIELLEHATVVGSLCRYLAVHLGLPHDELFTCGFLHDIGKLMLLDTEGDKYADLVRKFGAGPDQLHLQERRMFGFDHAVLGAHVLKAWNIPDPVPKVVAFHHQPARAMHDTLLSSMVQALRLADLMSYAVQLETDSAGVLLVAESEAAQYLDISEPQVAAMWADVRALADRSRARSNGQADLEVVAPRRLDVPRSLRPRRSGGPRSQRPDSLRPEQGSLSMPVLEPAARTSNSSPPTSSRPSVNEVPAHFPCVACSKPSFGNLCAACGGQVCPEHQAGPDQWCVLCLREYEKFVVKKQIPSYLKVTGLALAGFSVGASVTGAMVSQTYSPWKLLLAPLTMCLLWGILLPVLHRLWQRRRFLSTRPKGRVPVPIKLPRPNEVFISSLDASLESEGLMGPSLAPPSRSSSSMRSIAIVPSVPTDLQEPQLPPSETGPISIAPQALRSPVTDRSPADHSRARLSVNSFDTGPPSSDRDLDRAAEALERSSEVMAKAPVVTLVATSVPPTAPATPVSSTPSASAASTATTSRRPSTQGFSEFPSVSSESELENVVASVSARLGRDLLPSNDYMGPSAELRAATIAPIPEDPLNSIPAPAPMQVESVTAPAPLLVESSLPAPAPVETALTPTLSAERAEPSPVLAQPEVPLTAAPLPVEAVRVTQSAPNAEGDELDQTQSPEAGPDVVPLLFPRLNLERGCAPRKVFRCAIPISEVCSPAPRRSSLRPGGDDFATSGAGPSKLRDLG